MNKIKQILIGASLVALSGNAAAIMIEVGGSEYSDFESLVPVIQGMLDNANTQFDLSDKQHTKLSKKYRKHGRIEARLESGDLSEKKTRKKVRKVARLEKNMMKKLGRWDTVGVTGLPILEGPGPGECGGQGDECNGHGVPEPSTIALLGLGLVGIGAARRLRKKTH